MTFAVIEGETYDIPVAYAPGAPIDNLARVILTDLYISRLRARINSWCSKSPKTPAPADVRAKALELAGAFEFTDEPEPDAIDNEARAIAEEIILTKLEADGLPPPRAMSEHIDQLASDPRIIAQARIRVVARLEVSKEMAVR